MTERIAVASPRLKARIFNQLLPPSANNTYSGHKLALWFFALVVLLKLGISLDSIFNGYAMASSGDGIALGTFSPAGAQTLVSLYALWGLEHLMLCLLCLWVLVRHRTLIPFMFALLLLEQLSRKLIILHFLPIAKTWSEGDSPGISPFPYGFLALMIVGLALSLRSQDNPQA